MVEIKVYFEGNIYNLIDDIEITSLHIQRTADKTMDQGSFTIPDIEQDRFDGLDMSRPLPRNARVRIGLDGIYTDFNIESDMPTRLGETTRYKHDVKLISPSKMAMDYSATGLTVTQPQGDIGLYYRSVNKDDTSQRLINTFIKISNYAVVSNSIDLNVLDGVIVKDNQTYRGEIIFLLQNKTKQPTININTPIEVKVTCGSYEQVFNIIALSPDFISWINPFDNGRKTSQNIAFEFDNVGVNEVEVSIRLKDIGNDYDVSLLESVLSIYTTNEETMDLIRLDYVTEKILNNEMNAQKFYLDNNSKALLGEFVSYEWTLPTSYIWTQITRIADYIKAFPRVYYQDESVISRLMVELIPFDNLLVEQAPPEYNQYNSEATMDDYSSSVEVIAENVYSPNAIIKEKTTLRVDGANAQITTDNLIAPTQYRIGQVVKINVSYGFPIIVGSTTYPSGYVFTLENAVFDKNYYDTLSSQSDYTLIGRETYNQNNTIYFVEGERNLRGLSNLGGRLQPTPPFTNTYIRAVYEMTLAELARRHGENPSGQYDYGDVETDNTITIEIEYRPYTETNAVMFKDDQKGFQFKSRKILNETMEVNDPDVLGAYAQGIANRSGGTKHTYSGIATPTEIPEILSTFGDKVLFASSVRMINYEECEFVLYYIKDYIFISSYESYDQKERVFQVPSNKIIERVIKKNNFIIFSERGKGGNDTNYQLQASNFVQHLIGGIYLDYAPKNAKLTFLNSESSESILLSLDTKTLARTIEFRVKPKDNYSAGVQKYKNGDKWYQKDYRYSNSFGRVEDVTLEYYNDIILTNMQRNELPKAPTFTANQHFLYQYNLRKDAREIPVFSTQYSYMSESDNIVVYDDIAKSSYLLNRTDIPARDVIKLGELDYIPSKNAKMIDLTRVTPLASGSIVNVSTSDKEGYLQVTTNNAKPIVIYDSNTKEILLVDKRELEERVIYYRLDRDIQQYFGLRYNLTISVKETLSGELVTVNNISETLGVILGYDYGRPEYQPYNLTIKVKETLSGSLTSINNIRETIGVTLGYGSYIPLKANLFIDIQETLDGGLLSINTLYEVINAFIGFEGNQVPKTATPTVPEPFCRYVGGANELQVSITNNETSSVTIRNGTNILDTINASATKTIILVRGISIPYNYNINITAQASGLQPSTNVNRNGTVTECPI